MVTTCAANGMGGFSTRSGYGVPKGLCALEAGGPNNRCERYGEFMTYEEARAEGLRQGYLVEFRTTDSFFHLAAAFMRRGPHDDSYDPFLRLCEREELDPDEVRKEVARRGLS